MKFSARQSIQRLFSVFGGGGHHQVVYLACHLHRSSSSRLPSGDRRLAALPVVPRQCLGAGLGVPVRPGHVVSGEPGPNASHTVRKSVLASSRLLAPPLSSARQGLPWT